MSRAAAAVPLLQSKRILVTGVLTRSSIAYKVAETAQALGADVVLTGHGRSRRITERTARSLPKTPVVLELDVNSASDLLGLRSELAARWQSLDGVVHAIAHAPADALGGDFIQTSADAALEAFRTSAYSFSSLAGSLRPLMERNGSGSLVAIDFDASVAWPSYDWMGVAKAGLEAVGRYLSHSLGPSQIRVNLVASGPLRTAAAGAFDDFDHIERAWTARAPLGWDSSDAGSVANAVCFLLSDMATGISGQVLKVDGGFSAVGIGPADVTQGDRVATAVEGAAP